MLESKFEQTSSEIVQRGGQFFEKRTVNGVSNLFPIDLTLSPTRDPVEALQRQKINEGITFAQQAALAGPGLQIGRGLFAAAKNYFGARAPRLGQQIKGLFVQPRPVPLAKIQTTPTPQIPTGSLPGGVVFSGLEPTRLTKGLGVGAGVGALGFLKADPTEMQEQVDALDVKSENQELEEQVQNNQDLQSADIATTEEEEKIRQEVADTDVSSAVLDNEVLPKPKTDPISKPEPEADINPLFDNPNFSILIRNIGKSLAETGQVGSGLTLGAAAAAEEVAVRVAQKEAAQQELLKEAIKAGAKKTLDPKFKDEVDQKYIDNTQRIEENKGSLDFLNQIENILLTDNPTGIPGLARQIGYKFRALLDPNAELDPKTRVENLLNEIAVGDAATILGQSSGRLSDRDIILAKKLVSEIEGISGAFTSESAIISILARRRADIERDQATAASELMQANILYNEYGLKPPPTAIFDYLSTSPSAANTNIAGEANLGD